MRRILLLASILLLVPWLSLAQVASSTSFILNSGVIDAGGAQATSTSFGLESAIGQPAVGISTSTSFAVLGGFLYASALTIIVAPNAPSSLVATPSTPTAVNLSWTDNSDNETGFSIERKTGAGGTYAQIGTVGANVTAFMDSGASPSTTYFYRVRAFTGATYSSYSNEASVTTSAVSGGGGGGGSGGGGSGGGGSGGGGGGGGGGASGGSEAPTPSTNVVISGSAYPLSQVTVLKDGQVAVQTIAGPDANFSVTIGNLSGGSYTFSVYSQDSAGRRSSLFTFPVSITVGATTDISGVFLSPTIDVDKSEVKQGDTLVIFGQSVPSSSVSIQINSSQTLFLQASTSPNGAYLYDLDTAPLELGSHSAKSKTVQQGVISNDSISQAFTVGSQNIAEAAPSTCPAKGDLNGDCRVNLIDFSILAYWYGKPNPPKAYLLDGKAAIDLVDFSIMAYYWTG